ncbi:MAG: Gfo/Idh/MocA family protein [Solirubrobacteraceae bacterium]
MSMPAAEVLGGGRARPRIGVGVIGLGWLGRAHSRSLLRIPTLFREREFDARLVICADTVASQLDDELGFGETATDWRRVVDHPGVNAVFIAAPNMLHVELIEAAAAAGKHIFCEKPVGGTPEQTERAERAARAAGVITGVGYNYRWAPLVRYAARLIEDGRLGEITNYRGRFLSMYGSDPLGPLSWRYRLEEGGHGASTDLLSHSVDLATMLIGPIERVVGTTETFIRERPLSAGATHYSRGSDDDPRGPVTNEDYAAMLCEFAGGARGTFEASRTIVGPESQMAFDVHGTRGALSWNLERMNELQVYLAEDEPHTGYRTVFGGERFPYHGHFVPGSANGIGFEDLVVIEDYEFLHSVAEGRAHSPGFADALAFTRVQEALLESCRSGRWEVVRR